MATVLAPTDSRAVTLPLGTPPLPDIALHGRDWITVEIPGAKCPRCHGSGKHGGISRASCGVCLGSGKAWERKAITEMGKAALDV
jgi:hypothetical protein